MSKLCRVCLNLTNDDSSVRINTVEESSGFMPLRDKLTLCVPEMELDMIPDPVLCETCTHNLQIASEFKKLCLETEVKIRKLFQSVGATVEIHHTTETEKTPTVTKPPLKTEPDEEPTNSTEPSSSEPNNDPLAFDEEIQIKPAKLTTSEKRKFASKCAAANRQAVCTSGPVGCNFCGYVLGDLNLLREHQKECQEKEKLGCPGTSTAKPETTDCDFEPFDGQRVFKRRRRTVTRKLKESQKKTGYRKEGQILRSSLPNSAKEILRQWLFRHRWNPYPNDAEKLTLIQETNLSLVQVENWFINARRRILQRMIVNSEIGESFEKGEMKTDDNEAAEAAAQISENIV